MTSATLRAALVLTLIAGTPSGATTVERARLDRAVEIAKSAMLVDPRMVIKRADDAGPLVKAFSSSRERRIASATLMWLKSEALYRLDDVQHAAPLAAEALALVQNAAPDSKLHADILLTRGSINGKRVAVAAALADLQEAHRIFSKVGDQRKQAISLVCLAMLYVDAKDYATALHYLDEAREAYPADPGLAIAIFNTRGVALQSMGDYTRADAAFRRALTFARQVGGPTVEAQYQRNIARNYLLAEKLTAADRAIYAARALGGAGRDDARLLDAIAAQAAFQHRHLREAGLLIDRAFADIDVAHTDAPLRDAHQTAVSIYGAQHKAGLALAHLQALKRLDDQTTKLATQTSTALMAARFDSANQEAKIARLRDAERLRQAREEVRQARTERTLWLGGAGATAIIILLLLGAINAIRRSRDQVRAANDDLAVTNGALGKALAAKTEFLATTSHEIRTPLNGILGMTQVMLADGEIAPATRDRLTVVHGAGLTMRALVDDILDAAKMETGNLGLESAPFELRGLLADASRMWAEQAGAKGLTFTTDLDRCPAWVEGDAARVRQIVFNLLSNALKFTARGSVTLTAEQTGEGVRIAVADTGIGIALEQHATVFESFRQADTSTTRQFGGTGLGLSICRNLARAMGGDVTLASRSGEGSTFTVAFPLPAVVAPASACAAPEGGETLLVLDRNPISRAMFRTLFAPHVAVVAFAGSVDEASTCLASGSVTRILIDDATARIGGDPSGFIAAVVARAGETTVTLLWPVAAEQERADLLSLGVADVIGKPVTGAALVRRIFENGTGAEQSSLVSQAA